MPVILKENRIQNYPGSVLAASLQDLAAITEETWDVVGAPVIVETPYGKGMQFSGTPDKVDVPSTEFINFGTGDFSVAGLINISDYNQYYTIVSKKVAGGIGWRIYTLQTTGNLAFDTHDGVLTATYGGVFPFGWHHFACTRIGAVGQAYIDAVPTAGATRPGNLNSAVDLNIGAYNVIQYFEGMIKYLQVYNYGLSQADVTTLYNNIIGLGTNP